MQITDQNKKIVNKKLGNYFKKIKSKKKSKKYVNKEKSLIIESSFRFTNTL